MIVLQIISIVIQCSVVNPFYIGWREGWEKGKKEKERDRGRREERGSEGEGGRSEGEGGREILDYLVFGHN